MLAGHSKPISEAELAVLKLLWEQGPSTVRAVHEILRQQNRPWAYTTVLTLMSRLRDKGYVDVSSQRKGTAHVFRPTVSKHKLLKHRLHDLAEQICDGAASPLVHALVDSRQLSVEDIARLRTLLDQLEHEGQQPKDSTKPKRRRRGRDR